MSQIAAVFLPSSSSSRTAATDAGNLIATVNAMLDALHDCPCDAEKTWAHAGVALGCRLRSLAPEGAAETLPLVDESAQLALTADARLFDRDALCAALDADPAQPDGHLIMRAYQRWGADCVHHLQGDYAFVVADLRRATLFCARDPLGVRPLYHSTRADGAIVVSSDLIALRAALTPRTTGADELDEAFVLSYVADGHTWHPSATFDRRIKRLPLGHRMHVSESGVQVERWWHPDRIALNRALTFEDAVAITTPLLERVVADHLRTPRPVGMHVSGGLDSTLIAAIATQQRRAAGLPPPPAYAWCTNIDGPPRNLEERRLIETAQRLGLHLTYSELTAAELRADITRDVVEGIAAESLMYETSHVLPTARASGVSLILSGWGGDDVVSSPGRSPLLQAVHEGRWREALVLLLRLDGPNRRWHLRFLAWLAWHRCIGSKRPPATQPLLSAPYRQSPRPYRQERRFPLGLREYAIERLLHGRLSHRHESWAAAGARFGVQYGFPLLDRRLLELVLTFPNHVFHDGARDRKLIRAMADPLLPASVVYEGFKDDTSRLERMHPLLEAVVAGMLAELGPSGLDPSRARYIDLDALRASAVTPLGSVQAMRVLSFLTRPRSDEMSER